jgi:uncharacterized protein involved in response to NO
VTVGGSLERFRREPFRVLFPLGGLLAWAAVLPWVLFGSGVLRAWLGTYHALTMTQGFLVAVAFGFIGTMLPRRTGAAPLSSTELLVPIAALALVPALLLADRLAWAQVAYLVVLGTLIQFVLRRLRRAGRPPHPSFVFLPLGLVCGMVGSTGIIASTLGHPALLGPARTLVEEGVLLSLVLAMAPMLTSIIAHGRRLEDPDARAYALERSLHLAAAALLLASFVLQAAGFERGGLLTRAAVLAGEVAWGCGGLRLPTAAGLHRRLYWIALWMVPLGELAAGARPAWRVPLLHLTFVGGLSLLVFSVSFHVVFSHTGHEALASRRPWPVALVGGAVLAAATARACAERFSSHYPEALAVAASLWLAGAMLWAVYCLRLARHPAASHES